ncbi:hypothetical protein [Cardinium endosymbiont of Sogatella furcifera]|uniref:hypothetical protein n=1 Tax=Cardinium endosymbiont of Sogatella furcifera TaxID=650378 RepID=UPI000E0CE60A|nr:hypothetical protein [Cardinium endosymbiont of Sogatella furcifera]
MHMLKVLHKAKYLSVVIVLFLGCQQANQMDVLSKFYSSDFQNSSVRPDWDQEVKQAIKAYSFTTYCVWLAGMLEKNDSLKSFVDELLLQYKDSFIVQSEHLLPKSRLGYFSTTFHSFKKQADAVCKELKAKLTKDIRVKLGTRYDSTWSKEKYEQAVDAIIKHTPIVLSGFSQGGSIAVEIARNSIHYGLSIQGVLLMLTDLSGVVPFQKGMEDLRKFKDPDIRAGFEIVTGKSVDSNYSKMSKAKFGVGVVSPLLARFGYKTAIECMRPGSRTNLDHIQFVRQGIDATGSKHNIPILIVAGHIGDVNDYYDYDTSDDEKTRKVEAFNKGLNIFMSGHEAAYHDGAVPFKNQFGRGPSLEDITTFSSGTCISNIALDNMDYVMPNKPDNVDIYIVGEDVFHGKKKFKTCFAEFDNPKMLKNQELYEIEKVPREIIAWLNSKVKRHCNRK